MSNEIQQVNESVPLTIADMKRHLELIQQAMREVMTNGEDYGVIQGTKKPTLLKPGAEKLNLLFRLDPQYDIQETYEPTPEGPKHYTVVSKCTLYHSPTGRRLGSGYGSCSTKEKKYAYRDTQRKCPACGKETIIKGKEEYGGGWVCFTKKGGCNAKFKDADESITSQVIGQTLNPDLADQYNTILKMANKRSLVAASLNVTGASAIFTQDLEDMAPMETKTEEVKPSTTSKSEPVHYKWMDEINNEAFDPEDGWLQWFKATAAFADTKEEVEALWKEAKQVLDEAGQKMLHPHIVALGKQKGKQGVASGKS